MAETARKKLLILITKSNFGGAQRYVFDLSQSLKSYDVTVASGGEGLLIEKLKTAGARTITLPFLGRDVSILKDARSFFSLISLIRKEKPDIIHLNSSKIGIMGAVAAWLARSKAKTVFTAHAWAFNEKRSGLSTAVIMFLHWLTVFLCDKTITVSEGVKRQISHLPLISGKMTVVHLGIDKPTFIKRGEARAKLGIPERSFAIGTIAELHQVKGLAYAIDAVRGLPFKHTYTIMGTGDERGKLEAQISSSEISKESVRLTGFVPDAASFLHAFDVFLLPSLSEAFGYVLVEAGYAGLPVIATSVGGIPEIIEDMKSGVLIHPKNVKEIANALIFLNTDKDERTRLGKALMERVHAKFSLERMVKETIAVYESL